MGRNIGKILNQQKLPEKTEYLHLTTKEDIYDAIQTLKVRGAPAIGITAAFGLALCAQSIDTSDVSAFLRELRKIKDELNQARPTAVNLSWALNRLLKAQRAQNRSMRQNKPRPRSDSDPG